VGVAPRSRRVPGSWLAFRRIALIRAQAEEHELLDADGKAEADGLPVPVLDAIIREAIESLHDPAIRQRSLDEQERERRRITPEIRAALAESA
jgi:hypothetical protein